MRLLGRIFPPYQVRFSFNLVTQNSKRFFHLSQEDQGQSVVVALSRDRMKGPPDKLSDRVIATGVFCGKNVVKSEPPKTKEASRMLYMSDEIQFFCPECHTPFLMGLASLEAGAAHICASCGQRIEFVDESFDFEEETQEDFPRPVVKEWRH
ncbi:MAG TPA: hypothetical protein DCR97_02795 [Deltaproteobacteria bacterium]|nr:hypothetical protein [Deltaproteobacteria bacterium]